VHLRLKGGNVIRTLLRGCNKSQHEPLCLLPSPFAKETRRRYHIGLVFDLKSAGALDYSSRTNVAGKPPSHFTRLELES